MSVTNFLHGSPALHLTSADHTKVMNYLSDKMMVSIRLLMALFGSKDSNDSALKFEV